MDWRWYLDLGHKVWPSAFGRHCAMPVGEMTEWATRSQVVLLSITRTSAFAKTEQGWPTVENGTLKNRQHNWQNIDNYNITHLYPNTKDH